jgi:diguanylate cyclase (GGDEF)-like protein
LSWRAVLGVTAPDVAGWERVRAAQIGEFVRLSPLICLANVFNALALAFILWGSVPRWSLIAWAGAMLVAMVALARLTERTRASLSDDLPRGTIRGAVLMASLLGLLWALPPVLFARSGAEEQQLAICLVSAAIMASAALTCATAPAVMLTFVAISALGLSVMLAGLGSALLPLIPAIYAVSLALGGLALCHAFVRRKLAEIALEDRNEVVSLLLGEYEQSGADWLWQIDSSKCLHHVSPGLSRAAGLDVAALEGMPLIRLLAGDGWDKGEFGPELRALHDKLNTRSSFSDMVLPVLVKGETRWWRLSATPREDARGAFAGFRGVGSDVTEQRRSSDAIHRAARYDELTGLANRAHLTEILRKALGRAHRERGRCALLLIDLDHFKPVNDTLGHPVGDKLLKQVADRLRQHLAPKELCGRLGGDEFAIVIPDLDDSARVSDLADGVIASLTRTFEVDGNSILIGASIGAALGPKDGRTIETLLRNADLALYRAKEEGRGVHRRYEPQMLARAEKRRAIEAALREAMDKGQFHLVFQPIINSGQGNVEAFEALLRWSHPELGEVPPAEFMPIAEEIRISGRIGEWVLRTACAEAANWPDPVRVAVNVSTEQLGDPQLANVLLSALSHAGLAPGRLEIEISEAVLLKNNEAVLPAIDRLQTLGVRITLDDFGTGYASLGYVKQGRFAAIKIDNAFVRGAGAQESESIAIVRATVAMAGELGAVITAEGTETGAQHSRMRELGCMLVQGYHVGRPMGAEQARALISQGLRKAS